jgi:hypothetical protein
VLCEDVMKRGGGQMVRKGGAASLEVHSFTPHPILAEYTIKENKWP